MYIAPGFTLIACEAVSEEELRLWAVENGAVWLPAEDGQIGRRLARAQWNLGQPQSMQAHMMTLTDEDTAEWTPLMNKPPQSRIDVELSELLWDNTELRAGLIGAMLTHWDGCAYDLGAHEWVSALLSGLLPPERILRFVPPPPDENFGRFYTFSHKHASEFSAAPQEGGTIPQK